jgi:hypothetical protein
VAIGGRLYRRPGGLREYGRIEQTQQRHAFTTVAQLLRHLERNHSSG